MKNFDYKDFGLPTSFNYTKRFNPIEPEIPFENG